MSKLQDDIRSLLDLSVPAPGSEPVRSARIARPVYHSDDCVCEGCCTIRDAIERHLEARRLYNINTWWNS